MKDAEWAKKRKKVNALFDKWISILGLKWYSIEIRWKAGEAPDKGDDFLAIMNVKSRWEYRTATITVYLEDLPEEKDKLEQMVVHELMHIFIEPMRGDEVTKEEEYVAESLARAFMWVKEDK